MGGQRRPMRRKGGAEKLLAVLTSTVCQAVEDVAFITQALEAPSRVDAEMVAGAVEGALVDVCAQRETHAFRKAPQMTKDGPSLSSFLFGVCCFGPSVMMQKKKKKKAFERKTSPVCYLLRWSTSWRTYFYHFEAHKWNFQ